MKKRLIISALFAVASLFGQDDFAVRTLLPSGDPAIDGLRISGTPTRIKGSPNSPGTIELIPGTGSSGRIVRLDGQTANETLDLELVAGDDVDDLVRIRLLNDSRNDGWQIVFDQTGTADDLRIQDAGTGADYLRLSQETAALSLLGVLNQTHFISFIAGDAVDDDIRLSFNNLGNTVGYGIFFDQSANSFITEDQAGTDLTTLTGSFLTLETGVDLVISNDQKIHFKDTVGTAINTVWLDSSNFLNIGTIDAITGDGDVIFYRDGSGVAKFTTSAGSEVFVSDTDQTGRIGSENTLWLRGHFVSADLGRSTVPRVDGSLLIHSSIVGVGSLQLRNRDEDTDSTPELELTTADFIPAADGTQSLGHTGRRWDIFADALDVTTLSLSFTEGSVLFANASGDIAEDNANFFWHDTNNQLLLGATSPVSANSGLEIIGKNAGINDLVIQEEGTSVSHRVQIELITYSDGAEPINVLRGLHARGTAASPTAPLLGDRGLFLGARPWQGTFFTPSSVASVIFRASENITATNFGYGIDFRATDTGTTSVVTKLTISDDIIFKDHVDLDADSAYDFGEGGASPRWRFGFADVWNGETIEIENAAHNLHYAITQPSDGTLRIASGGQTEGFELTENGAGELNPINTGANLGTASLRWDGFLGSVDMSSDLLFGLNGQIGINTAVVSANAITSFGGNAQFGQDPNITMVFNLVAGDNVDDDIQLNWLNLAQTNGWRVVFDQSADSLNISDLSNDTARFSATQVQIETLIPMSSLDDLGTSGDPWDDIQFAGEIKGGGTVGMALLPDLDSSRDLGNDTTQTWRNFDVENIQLWTTGDVKRIEFNNTLASFTQIKLLNDSGTTRMDIGISADDAAVSLIGDVNVALNTDSGVGFEGLIIGGIRVVGEQCSSLPVDATDLATVITLANAIKDCINENNHGLADGT